MTEEQLKALEADLESRGYKKFTQALSSRESWGWFKSWKDRDNETLYIIEWRVWDYRQYSHSPEPFGVDTLILDGGGDHRIDLEITSPKFGICTVEDIAYKLHNMLEPYIEQWTSSNDQSHSEVGLHQEMENR